MNYRKFGRTGWEVSEISFGAWAIGGTWGQVDDNESMRALHKAVEQGINLFDTADVYGNGRSERLLAQLRAEHSETLHIITKAGRRLEPHDAAGYNQINLNAFVDRSLKNLRTDSLELVQLHCPPTDVYYMPEVFDLMDTMVTAGKIQHYGVSVERVEEALKAIEYPNVKSIQIIFNMFRPRPAELFFEQAIQREVAILARVPLASGLLTGKLNKRSIFEEDDHRRFNRDGEAFDKGETFSGVDYDLGLELVESLEKIKPNEMSMAQFALKWILMHKAISCAIPGGKTPEQVQQNAAASDFDTLVPETMEQVKHLYDTNLRSKIHPLW